MSDARFLVSSAALLKALEQVKGGLGTSNNVPVVQDFLLVLTPGRLRITASDLEVRLTTQLDVEAVDSASLCVPGRLLLDTLRHIPDQPTTFTLDTETFALSLKSATSQRRIAGEDARGFPPEPEMEPVAGHKMRAGGLQRALAKTVDFADPGNAVTMWTGVSICFAPKCLELAASDGMGTLVRYQQKYDSDKLPEPYQVLVPAKALKLLTGLLPKTAAPASIGITGRHFGVIVEDGIEFTCRLIDQAYVPYNKAIPREVPQSFVASREYLQTSLRGLVGYVNSSTLAACFDLSPTGCQLYADAVDYSNEAREQLPGDFTGTGIKAGFRLPNLVTALGVFDHERVQLSLGESGRHPALLAPLEQLANERIQVVLMPLAINL